MATPIPPNRARVSSYDASAATHGTLRAADPFGARVHEGLTTDTRAVVAGGVFVALRGEKHDAHAFLGAALDRGATLLVVERGRAPADARGADVLEVDDTLVAWGDLARAHLAAWRKKNGRRVVAITGSAGKTTTKELTAALLGAVGRVRATDGNLNNRIGVPAMIFTLDDGHDYAVLECGMSLPGEMALLASIVAPDVAAITFVGLAHAENVGGTREGVAVEKGALYAGSAPNATLVVNADDPLVVARAHALERRRVTFGRSDGADVRLVERSPLGFGGSRIVVQRAGEAPLAVVLPLVGEGAAVDFSCAVAAADAALGRPLSSSEIERGLAGVRPTEGRADVRTRGDGAVVVDDTYNANPQSMQNALTSLSEIARAENRRAVCVLGEMKEIGPLAEAEHDALGDAVADAGVALFVGCGGLVDRAPARAAARGVHTLRAADAREAAEIAVREVRGGDIVLVKASRSIGAERVVAALLAEGSGS